MNLSAPSILQKHVSTAAYRVSANFVASHALGCGLLLSPVFNNKKGSLYMDEHAILKCLVTAPATVDHRFTLKFGKRPEPWQQCAALMAGPLVSN